MTAEARISFSRTVELLVCFSRALRVSVINSPLNMSYLPFAKPTIDEDTIAAVADTLRSGWIASGPRVQEFEKALSDFLGGRIVRTFTSATGALEVALHACGIGPGDEVRRRR